MIGEVKRYQRIDRRKCLRLESSLPVEISLYQRESKTTITKGIPGTISQVSREGVCIETDTVMINGTHIFTSAMDDEFFLAMKISLPDSTHIVEALGAVAWYNLAPENSQFRFIAGIIISEIEPTSKKYWLGFISEIEKSSAPV
jgi:hypothetical protein